MSNSRGLAEAAGFEPTSAGVKDPCLTTWLRLNIKMPFATHSWETCLLLCSHPQMLVFHCHSSKKSQRAFIFSLSIFT